MTKRTDEERAFLRQGWIAMGLCVAAILLAIIPVLLASRNLDCRYASATAKAIMFCPGR